jgi:alpha-1,2-mannosyltransferase
MVSKRRATAAATATTATAAATATATTESSSSLRLSVFTLFLIFATVHVIGGTINHIDDTDEVYGYYEPLHYLLYGKGMQTWEYSPVYAIR